MVYLEDDQLQALKKVASAQRISLAELFRRLVGRFLKEGSTEPEVHQDKFLELVDLGASGKTDISERHDHYLAEGLLREHRG
ncbi:MAG: hypothetical protein V3T83_06830 [Acidobacteriota bacterium]